MNCRGNETRKRIITEYIVEPKAHLKLLANQRKNSDAKAIIEDEYYIFTAVRKRDGKEEIIQCGMGAARDFLKLLNHPGLPLFNPLKTDSTIKKDNNQKSNSQEIKVEKWNKTAKQLYNAIMWLITIWDAQPNTPLFEFRDEIVKYGDYINDFYLVPPGITGVWQVSGRSDTTFEQRAIMDSWYIHNWSIWIDIVYLLKTVLAVVKSKGAY